MKSSDEYLIIIKRSITIEYSYMRKIDINDA
jgi:hypothetical protein